MEGTGLRDCCGLGPGPGQAVFAAGKSGLTVSSKIIFLGDVPVLGEIMVKACVNVGKALPDSTARELHFLRMCPFPNGYVCLCWGLVFVIIINICLH